MKIYRFLIAIGLAALPMRAAFMTGDVLVSGGLLTAGAFHYSPSGKQLEILIAGTSVGGGAFDSSGNFYLTTYFNGSVLKFNQGMDLPPVGYLGAPGTTYLTQQHFPIGATFDAAGNLYLATSGATIPEYAPNGTLVRALPTGTNPTAGIQDVQISADQKTLYYSAGSTIQRIDLATGNLLSDFANVGGTAGEFQLLPDGGMLVANGTGVVRLNSTGQIVQTYSVLSVSDIESVALTPDGQHCWTAGYFGQRAVELDLASGAQVASFQTQSSVRSISVYAAASSGPAGPSNGGVPEPASLGLVAISLCGFALCRRRSA